MHGTNVKPSVQSFLTAVEARSSSCLTHIRPPDGDMDQSELFSIVADFVDQIGSATWPNIAR